MDARARNEVARPRTSGLRVWLTVLATVLVGWAGAAAGAAYVVDLDEMVADAAVRSGLSLRLEAGPCDGRERIAMERAYCVRHAFADDVRRLGADLDLRRWVAAGALARSLETHPRLVSSAAYPSRAWREPWTVFVVEYPEGLLEVRVAPRRPYQAAITFRPRDPVGPCLRAYDEAVDPFDLARAFGTFDAEQARTLLACTRDLGATDDDGRTALFEAVAVGDAAAVRAFLAAGWRHDARDDDGWTPLLLATRDASDPDIVLALLAAGADPTVGLPDAPARDALWYARRNADLAATEALIAVMAAFVARTHVRVDPHHAPREVASGGAPFLPPTPAPTEVEAVLLSGSMTVRGAATATASGPGAADVEIEEALDLRVDFELVRWTLPLVLASEPYLVAVTYAQRLDVTALGGGDLLDDFVTDPGDESWFELVDVRDGTWGATRFAIADDLGDPAIAAALDLVPLRGLLVGGGGRLPPDARIGVGSAWVSDRRVELEGGELIVEHRVTVVDVGDAGHTIDTREATVVPALVVRDGWVETVTSLRQETAVRTVATPRDRVHASISGDVVIEQTVSLRAGRDRVDVVVAASGPIEATLVPWNWRSLTPEDRRGVVQRIVRLLTRYL